MTKEWRVALVPRNMMESIVKSVICLKMLKIKNVKFNKNNSTYFTIFQPIDRCSETDHSYVCRNGGTCLIDDAGQLTCKCHQKYTGQRCELGKKTKIYIKINQCFII